MTATYFAFRRNSERALVREWLGIARSDEDAKAALRRHLRRVASGDGYSPTDPVELHKVQSTVVAVRTIAEWAAVGEAIDS